jgi:hypothetical protein
MATERRPRTIAEIAAEAERQHHLQTIEEELLRQIQVPPVYAATSVDWVATTSGTNTTVGRGSTQETATAVTPPAKAPGKLPHQVRLSPRTFACPAIHLVGCGGTGSRVLPLLLQSAPRGASLTLYDPDLVEERNLVRQPFLPRHIGRPKVEALLERYQAEATRRGITLRGFVQPVGERMGEITNQPLSSSIVVGCVDQNAVRAELWDNIKGGAVLPFAYLDAGNELRNGQVVLNFWVVSTLNQHDEPSPTRLETFPVVFPEMIRRGTEAPGPRCGEVVLDSQTLQANVMAAGWLSAMFAWLVDEVPFSVAAVRFSTIGAHAIVPITGVDDGSEYYSRRLIVG